MPANTENISRWIEQSDIDYISYYIKAWIPFNAWFNNFYGSDSNLNSDRAKINAIKRDSNTARNKINSLMENNSPECLDFRSHLASLHHELLNTEIQGRDGRVWFQDILKERNLENCVNESHNRVHYFLQTNVNEQGQVSGVQVCIKKRNNTQTVFQYQHTEYDLQHLLNYPDLGHLSGTIQERIRLYFKGLEPFLIKPVIAIDLTNTASFYSCENVNFVRNSSNTNCYSISVCKSLIEVLYQLRNVVFHGELVPNKDSQRVYKNAYFCLKHILESLR